MMKRLNVDWDESRLGQLRFEARKLVARLRPRVRALAPGAHYRSGAPLRLSPEHT